MADKKLTPGNWLGLALMGMGGGLTGKDVIGNYLTMRIEREKLEAEELAKKAFNDFINQKQSGGGEAGETVVAPAVSGNLGDNAQFIKIPDYNSSVGYRLEINPLWKASGEQAIKDTQKIEQETKKTLSGTTSFVNQFERSYNELSKEFPEFGDVGFTGFMTRKGAKIANMLDQLPETKAFQVELKPLANQMARDIEGGRVTDQDRQIYADSFANTLGNPTQTNIRLISNRLLRLKNEKGGDISKVVLGLASSKTDILQKIAQEIFKENPELELQLFPDRFEVVK